MKSIHLKQCLYDHGALDSFIEKVSVGVLSSLIGLTLVILLYKDVFKRLVRDVFEVWDLVAKKHR
uniref:Uncharacterized protein n=1 Tax=Geoglobus ahangari TaxID=113653 RepID=A0A7C3UGR9_9EURY